MTPGRERFPPGILLLLLGLSLAAAVFIRLSSPGPVAREAPLTEHRRTEPALGTFATIVLIADDSLAEEIYTCAGALLTTMDRELGFRGGGSLSALNASGAGSLQAAPGPDCLHPALIHLIELSDTLCLLTGGTFDPSVGALTDLWGWPSEPVLPDSRQVDSVLALTGWNRVVLTGDSIRLPEGMKLDFGAVAKGYTVDLLYRLAMSMGASGALVEIGGEVRCGSTCDVDRTWRIAVRHPREEGFWETIELTEGAVATSGDYESFFVEDGVRYCHLLDPATGWPSGRTVSVTVTADRCDVADALATAVAVGGTGTAMMLPDSLYGYMIVLAEDAEGGITEWTTGSLR